MVNISKQKILEAITNQLDITPTMHKTAVERYDSIARCLSESGIEANFYVQGSFRLGTVTRPIRNGVDGSYDIDLVCEGIGDKQLVSPSEIKNAVGDALKQHGTYRELLEDEGRRCWTLEYAEKDGVGFHIDILPSLKEDASSIMRLIIGHSVNPEYAQNAIAITDWGDTGYDWETSNPIGYGMWFDEINKPFLLLVDKEVRKALTESYPDFYASVDAVPEFLVRTPLQRVIQILKRHRDVRFNGKQNENDKPISMIITTLTAEIVKTQRLTTPDTCELLNRVVENLDMYAQLLNGTASNPLQFNSPVITRNVAEDKWRIPNPTNPEENFAEKWNDNDQQKARAFFQWVKWVRNDLVDIINNPAFEFSQLNAGLGENVVSRARQSYSPSAAILTAPVIQITSPTKSWGEAF